MDVTVRDARLVGLFVVWIDQCHELPVPFDDQRFQHATHVVEFAFDLFRIYVLSVRTEYHAFAPAFDKQRVVLVHRADVAGVQPALFVDDLPGCFRVFVVSFHHVRTFDPDFTLSALVGIVDFNLYAFHDRTYSLKEGL